MSSKTDVVALSEEPPSALVVRSHAHAALDAIPHFAPMTLRTLTSLDLSHNHLLRLDGLQALPALTALDASSNFLESENTFVAELAQCVSLTSLSLANNWLRHLDGVEQLERLVHLDVRSNRIKRSIDIRSLSLCSLVRTLRLGGNPLVQRAAKAKGVAAQRQPRSHRAMRALLLNLVPQLTNLDEEAARAAPRTSSAGAAPALAAAASATEKLLAAGARVDPSSVFASSTRIAAAAALVDTDTAEAIAEATGAEAVLRADVAQKRAAGCRRVAGDDRGEATNARVRREAAAMVASHRSSYNDLYRTQNSGRAGVVKGGAYATPSTSAPLVLTAFSDEEGGEGAPPMPASTLAPTPTPQLQRRAVEQQRRLRVRVRTPVARVSSRLYGVGSHAPRTTARLRAQGERREARAPSIPVRALAPRAHSPTIGVAFGRTTLGRASPDLEHRTAGRDPFVTRLPGSAASPNARVRRRCKRRVQARAPKLSPNKPMRAAAEIAHRRHAAAAASPPPPSAFAGASPVAAAARSGRRIGGSALRSSTNVASDGVRRAAAARSVRQRLEHQHALRRKSQDYRVPPRRLRGAAVTGAASARGGDGLAQSRAGGKRGGRSDGGRSRARLRRTAPRVSRRAKAKANEHAVVSLISQLLDKKKEWLEGNHRHGVAMELPPPPAIHSAIHSALDHIDSTVQERKSVRGAVRAMSSPPPPPPPPPPLAARVENAAKVDVVEAEAEAFVESMALVSEADEGEEESAMAMTFL
jgi:hypothetical protein